MTNRHRLHSTRVFALRQQMETADPSLAPMFERVADRSYSSLETIIYVERVEQIVKELKELVESMDSENGVSHLEVVKYFQEDSRDMVKTAIQKAIERHHIRKESVNHIARYHKPLPVVQPGSPKGKGGKR
jgi:sugar-specific transcriptional regulator TrmB